YDSFLATWHDWILASEWKKPADSGRPCSTRGLVRPKLDDLVRLHYFGQNIQGGPLCEDAVIGALSPGAYNCEEATKNVGGHRKSLRVWFWLAGASAVDSQGPHPNCWQRSLSAGRPMANSGDC